MGSNVESSAYACDGIDSIVSLKALIKENFVEVRDKPPLKKGDYLRVSSLAMLCPREEVIVSREGLTRKDDVQAGLNMIFAHGHALHWAFQNHVLPSAGVLRGKWVCLGCSQVYGFEQEGAPILECAVERPQECDQCGRNSFFFEEYDLVDHEYRITGHSDGFLALPGMPGLGVFEGKSINPRGAWEVKSCPKMDHVVQAQAYMWLTGALWGKLVYWDKAGSGMNAIIEHTLERDESIIGSIKSTLKSIWRGVDGKKSLPKRICEISDCKRAKECSVSEACFEKYRG